MSTRRRSEGLLARRAPLLFGLAALLATLPARADDDDLSSYRDRFRLGMEKYKAGGVGEAISIWSAIYSELGAKRGYRLAFNLARALDTNGDATRAAERYSSFLEQAAMRQNAGEKLEPLVEQEVSAAEERMRELIRTRGRIEIDPDGSPALVQVDDTDPRLGAFTAYVAPGRHVVTFGPGGEDAVRIDVDVAAGELVIPHPMPQPAPATPGPLPAFDPLFSRTIVRHPFSPVVLYAGAVLTVASVLVPVFEYSHALSVYAPLDPGSNASPTQRQNADINYPAARNLAYGTLAVPISLGAITGGLTVWYFAAAHEQKITLSFDAAPGAGGASVRGVF